MIDFAAIQDALADWIENEGFLPVWSDQAGHAAPSGPYVLLKMLSSPLFFTPEFVQPDNTGIAQIHRKNIELIFSVQAIAASSDAGRLVHMGMASDLHSSLFKPDVIDSLKAACLVVFDTGPILDVTARHETNFSPRANFDVFAYTSDILEIDTGFIDSVELQGNVNS